MRHKTKWALPGFQIFRSCGGGRHSCVYSACCRATGVNVALKVYHWYELSAINVEQVQREVALQGCLKHPNAVPLYAAFADGQNVVLAMEYAAGGDVYKKLYRHGRYAERDAVAQVILPVLDFFQYMHAKGFIHRDLKPENLLLTEKGVLKVADFGLSIDAKSERPVTRLGTLDYMSPEVLACPDKSLLDKHTQVAEAERVAYSWNADIWGVGVLAHEILTGHAPFEAKNREQTSARISKNQRDPLPSCFSDQARSFVEACMHPCAAARQPASELLRHPWITANRPRVDPRSADERTSSENALKKSAPRPTLLYVPAPLPPPAIAPGELDATNVAASIIPSGQTNQQHVRFASKARLERAKTHADLNVAAAHQVQQANSRALAKEILRRRTAVSNNHSVRSSQSVKSSHHGNKTGLSNLAKVLAQYLAH